MPTPRRNIFLALIALAALAACGGKSAPAAGAAGEMALGKADAPVTLIEYASVTCSHCREFHEKVWPGLKANYIDSGKIRFVFREFPTAPPEVAVAGFQVARCNAPTPEQYFQRLDVLFDQQEQVFAALQQGRVRDQLLTIAKSAGLTEDQFNACVADAAGVKRIQDTVAKGESDFKIEGTPTLILNNEKLTAPESYSYEGLSKMIDAKLAGR
jgi:protein-disulfide isomerase